MSSIGQRTRSSRGSRLDAGTSSSMPERQEEMVLSSAQLTLVRAQARRIAREKLSAATGIGELVRQMVEDEVSALRSSGKLIPDRAQAAQVSKIVDELQAVEVARQKREGDVHARLTELERRGTDASPSGSRNKELSDTNRRIEVLEVSLGLLLEDGGRVTSTAEAGALNERLRVLEAKVESLTPLLEQVNKFLARLDKLEKNQQSMDLEVGRLLDNMQPLPLRLDQQTENIQSLTNSIEILQSQMNILQGQQELLLLRTSRKDRDDVPRGSLAGRRKISRDSFRSRDSARKARGNLLLQTILSGDESEGGRPPSRRDDSRSRSPSRSRRSRRPRRHYERSRSPQSSLGPRKSGLAELKPTDPRFKSVVSHRRYRLRNTDKYRGRSVADKIGTYSQRIRPFMKDSKFSAEDPITILAFLTKLKTHLDNNRISEGAALLLIPDYLEDPARDDFLRHCDLGADVPGGFDSFSGAIQNLLRTYAKDAYLEEALVELEDLKQGETEREFSRRLMTAVYRLAGAITETDRITRFIRGCRADIRAALRTVRAENPMKSYDYFVERAAGFGETHRALARPSTRKLEVFGKTKSRQRHVNVVEPDASDVSRPDADDDVVLYAGGISAPTIPTTASALQSTQSDTVAYTAPSAEGPVDVYAIHHNRGRKQEVVRNHNPRLPTYAQPPAYSRPGWILPKNEPGDICFECFALGHKRPNCPHLTRPYLDAGFLNIARGNYAKLNDIQRATLRSHGRTPAFALADDPGTVQQARVLPPSMTYAPQMSIPAQAQPASQPQVQANSQTQASPPS